MSNIIFKQFQIVCKMSHSYAINVAFPSFSPFEMLGKGQNSKQMIKVKLIK